MGCPEWAWWLYLVFRNELCENMVREKGKFVEFGETKGQLHLLGKGKVCTAMGAHNVHLNS